MALIELRNDSEAIAAYFAGQSDVVAAYLLEPAARGQADRLSDVDIAVLLDVRLGATESAGRQLRIMGDLEEYANREVQMIVLNRATPLLAYQAIQHGILLYERSRAERIEYEVQTRRVYFDLKPRVDSHTQSLLTDIKAVGLSRRSKRRGGTLEATRRAHRRLTGAPE